nr:bifunctional diguanylate cyclase/phosphodiesterase [Lachnospiraceae bacterium]
LVILLYSVFLNRTMFRKIRGKFMTLIVLAVLETILSRLETWFGKQVERSIWRSILSTACYILRPLIMYVLLLIVVRKDSRLKKFIYSIPLILASIALIIDIPYSYNLIFTYNENNSFRDGPLFFITYGILIVYLALILVMTFVECDLSRGFKEMLAVIIGIVFIILNIVAERFISGYMGGNTGNAIVLAILLYAIHFNSQEDQKVRLRLETTEQKTGLLNESACIAKLNEMLQHSNKVDYATAYFDLERFGLVNDKYGMDIGNRVLAEYAAVLGKMIRQDEILARQGGDRFIAIVLKRNLDVFLAQLAYTKVKFSESGVDYDIDISAHVGIHNIETDDISAEEVISNAYEALNYGKNAGNRVTYMNSELKAMIKDEKKFSSDIPIAMANEEFVAYYQPKVNSRTNNLCGAEALVRWVRNGELIPPGKFIPIMETKDLMCDMDFYMLRHVCADIAQWIEQGLVPPTVSVNFSRRNLSNPNLAADIDAVVQQYHVPKKMIEIEITETIDEFPISVLKGFVDDLHKLGYKVAVDDFGSGSSSLSLLREVTFDTLKIDKGFVDKAYAKDLAILSYMIKLAKAIGAETLAEGVEQREQVDTLLSLGCEIIQGYYYDRPLSKDIFERRIINRRYKVEQS